MWFARSRFRFLKSKLYPVLFMFFFTKKKKMGKYVSFKLEFIDNLFIVSTLVFGLSSC